MILLSFCSFPWWLAWLLPFLLGLLTGWALWSKWKGMYADLEAKVNGYKSKITSLEADLAACKAARSELDGEIALHRGRVREMETALKEAQSKATKVAKSTPSVDAASLSSGFAASTPAPKTDEPKKDSGSTSIYASITEDNLQIIEGIGPKMESVLKENGVKTLSMLGGTTTADVQAILGKYGDKYKIIDPQTWVQQAGLAAGGKWEELIDLQKRLDTGVANAKGMTDSKLEKYMIKKGLLRAYKQDDLKAVEGIGPAIEKLMHAAGINTWRGMADSSVERLKGILDDAGSRFKLADPGTWPKQAEMAADGKFKELQEYQDFLQGGK